MRRTRSIRAGVHVGQGGRLVERGQQRVDGAERVRAQQLGAADLGHVVGAVELVQGPQHVGDLADRSAALVAGHPRPAPAQRPARHPVDDQPVGAELAAVGLDRGVADLGGQQGPERGLAAEALVGAAVDPHHVAVAEPDLVGDAGRALQLEVDGESRLLERASCPRHCERVAHVGSGPVMPPRSTAAIALALMETARTTHGHVSHRVPDHGAVALRHPADHPAARPATRLSMWPIRPL